MNGERVVAGLFGRAIEGNFGDVSPLVDVSGGFIGDASSPCGTLGSITRVYASGTLANVGTPLPFGSDGVTNEYTFTDIFFNSDNSPYAPYTVNSTGLTTSQM